MIDDYGFCPKCGFPREYSEKRDAFFCPVCDEWHTPSCNEPDCEYCVGRPEKPSQDLTPCDTCGARYDCQNKDANSCFSCGNCGNADGGTCQYAGEISGSYSCNYWIPHEKLMG